MSHGVFASEDRDLSKPNVEASLISDVSQIAPGESFTVMLRHVIRPGWHTYWRNPGDSGAPTTLDWQLPAGFSAAAIEWPYPERIPYGPLMNFGYHGEVYYPITITTPETIDASSVLLKAKGEWLVCADVCIPERAELGLELAVGERVIADEANQQILMATRQLIPQEIGVEALVSIKTDGDAEQVQLDITLPQIRQEKILNISYFPFQENVIDNAAPQQLSFTGTGVRLQMPTGYEYQPDASFDGVVVIEEDAGDAIATAFEIHVGQQGAQPVLETETGLSLLTAIAFAFLGGLILNLMPCVFPVLSIKILSLVQQSDHIRGHGWMYLAGVVVSFVAIAGVLIGLRAGGAEIGWGFQLQSPWVVGGLIYLFLLVGLNLSGYFEFGTSVMGVGQGLTQQDGYTGSFFTGILATLVAAPCTAPFMASAIGFALTQSALAALLIFLFLGLGMAAPYVLLCYSPGLLAKLPRPGPWMERFKELLAFPLYASAVWLLWVLSLQVGANGVVAIGAGAVAIVFAIWLFRHLPVNPAGRLILQLFALISIGFALYSPTQLGSAAMPTITAGESSAGAIRTVDAFDSEPYTEARLEALRSTGPVFLNFTAAWCIACKVNEVVALSSDDVVSAFKQKQVHYLKGDWTNEDPLITKKLAEFGRNGVPLYALYVPGEEPVILPQILTPDIVLRALDKIP